MSRQLWRAKLCQRGAEIGRAGMSELVIKAVAEFDGSYIGAMVLAGRLKAISQMADSDSYWREKVDIGYHRELDQALTAAHTKAAKAK